MGRGSSKGGGTGAKYKGSSISKRNIERKGSLEISYGAELQDQKVAIANVKGYIRDKYDVDDARFLAVEIKGKDSNVIGFYDGENISINQKYRNGDYMNSAYDECVASGYHPSRGKKTGMEAVMAHEYGHALTDKVGAKMGTNNIYTAAENIISEATGKKFSEVAKKISRYAQENPAETVAEAFSDVYCNGSKDLL